MDCAELERHLTEFFEGELDPETEAAALEHLATCERCEQVLSGTRQVISMAKAHGRVVLAPEERAELRSRVIASVDALGPDADGPGGERPE